MFLGTFAWSFVYVSLPFHIREISPLDPAATLTWTGWILGIANLATVVVAPVWGRFAERRDTKLLYAATQGLQGVAFFGMALARTLPELFVSRLVLGVIGASSTFAFVNAGRSADAVEIRRQIAAVQSGMTIGQVIGPLVGAITAARLGFRPSFVVGGLILWGCGALAFWGLPSATEPREPSAGAPLTRVRDVVAVALVVLGGSTQVFFLTSILPQILPDLGVPLDQTLEIGGILMFVSAVAAAIGALVTTRLAELVAERRLLVTLLCAASALQAALAVAHSVWLYGVVRFLQVLCIAPVFPLVVGRIAQSGGGSAIGLVNSARIGAAFVGPVIATTILAWTSPALLYLVLAAIGVACLPLVMMGYQERVA
jgi:MFS transporter, DHA1 family, multidrug resistance protein